MTCYATATARARAVAARFDSSCDCAESLYYHGGLHVIPLYVCPHCESGKEGCCSPRSEKHQKKEGRIRDI